MQIVEIGVRILRRRWRPLIAAAALFGGVAVVLSETASAQFARALASMVSYDATGRPELVLGVLDPTQLIGPFAWTTAGTLLVGASLTLASLVASLYVDSDYRGSSLSLRGALSAALWRAPSAIGTWLLSMLTTIGVILTAAGLAGVVLLLFPPAAGGSGGLGVFIALVVFVAALVTIVVIAVRWCTAPVVVALERAGPVGALRRSWHLTGGNAWRTFGLQALVVFVVSVIVSLISETLDAFILEGLRDQSTLLFGLQVSVSVVLSLLTAPVLPVMLSVLYFDLLVRREGLLLSMDR